MLFSVVAARVHICELEFGACLLGRVQSWEEWLLSS